MRVGRMNENESKSQHVTRDIFLNGMAKIKPKYSTHFIRMSTSHTFTFHFGIYNEILFYYDRCAVVAVVISNFF